MRIFKAFLQILALIPLFCLLFLVFLFIFCLFVLVAVSFVIGQLSFLACLIVGFCLFLLLICLSLIELPLSLFFKKPIYCCQLGKWFFGLCGDFVGDLICFVNDEIIFRLFDLGEGALFFVFDVLDSLNDWGGLTDIIGDLLDWLNKICRGPDRLNSPE